MTHLFLGVDVGGSKTHALIATEDGKALGFGESGPGNHESVGYEGLFTAMHECVTLALAMAEAELTQISGAGFGVSGYDWPSERQPTLDTINKLGLACPLEAANDMMVGLLAGTSQGWGVVVDAGTGDNCMGRDAQGRVAHMTGCGPAFGEFGGSGSLVMRATQAIAYEWGKRGPATRLTPAFIELTGAKNVDDLLEGLALGYYTLWGDAAVHVFRVANEGDQAAKEAIAWAAGELGSMVNGIIRQLHFEGETVEVVMIGSMFNGGPLLLEPFKQTVLATAPKARFIRLDVPPVVGGVLMGMEAAGMKALPLREKLIASTKALLGKRTA
ncbi:MAG TPA: BadF/BadG/BcrA/BcrD ATPase family protein [Longilinea sp.]|nr:BadF/BadG/BcrA/BcrD ATPase family protein [Longilinea sp.]